MAVGLARVAARQGGADRFEADTIAVHEARRQGFLAIAAGEPGRCAVVDGSGDPDTVAALVAAVVTARLDLPLGPEA